MKQANSDPLPYVQVDRAAKPKAALLAGAMGTTVQHALGSLVEWWDLCGDPRELEAIAESTPTDTEPAVVLDSTDAALRFRLASGHDIEPLVLARLGLLEPHGEGKFRVRGMSRYFAPVLARLRARRAASVGGKASVASRKAATGSAQPRSESRSGSAQATTEATPKRDRADHRSDAEAGPKLDRTLAVSGQRSAVSSSLFPFGDEAAERAAKPKRKAKPRDPDADPRHHPLVAALVAAGAPFTGGRDAKRVTELLALGGQACDVDSAPAEVLARWQRALRHQGYPTVRSLGELVTHWGHFGAPPSDLPAWSEVEGSREVAF